MGTGSLTFRIARALGAGLIAAMRWLVVLAVVVAIGLPLIRIAANWYVRGSIDLAPPEEFAAASDMRLLPVSGGTTDEVDAVRSAVASLRYRLDPRAVSVVVVGHDPLALGAQGEYLPYLDIIRLQRSVVDGDGAVLRWTVAHEIGHYVDQRFMTDTSRTRFRQLRGITPSLGWQAPNAPWNERPDEDFAEVFAALAVPSAVAPPATAYGRLTDAGEIVSLLHGVGVDFGKSPPPTGWKDVVIREFELVQASLNEPSVRRPLLALVAIYLALGAVPAMARSWRTSAEEEGVPHERPLDSRVARVLNTPRLVTHTSRSTHVTHESRHHGSRR